MNRKNKKAIEAKLRKGRKLKWWEHLLVITSTYEVLKVTFRRRR